MKKYFSLFSILLMTAAAHAQTVGTTARELSHLSRQVARAAAKGNPLYIPWMQTVGDTGLYSFQLTAQLSRQSYDSFCEAQQAQETIPYACRIPAIVAASLKVKNPRVLKPLLADAPSYVQTKKQMIYYLLAKETNLYAEEVKRLNEHVWPQLREHFYDLENTAAALQQPLDPVAFITEKITPDITTLGIGEVHDFSAIEKRVSQLLTQLRQTQPQREIILFTEFLPQNFLWEGEIPDWSKEPFWVAGFNSQGLLDLWNHAQQLNIPVVGLEPMITFSTTKYFKSYFSTGSPAFWGMHVPVYASLVGTQYRNGEFARTLKQYRQQYPDALFVIYAGQGHVGYNSPFSFTAQLPEEKTFVLYLSPTQKLFQEKTGMPFLTPSPLSLCFSAGYFPQPVIYWDNKEFARITGFDAFLRVGETAETEKEEKK